MPAIIQKSSQIIQTLSLVNIILASIVILLIATTGKYESLTADSWRNLAALLAGLCVLSSVTNFLAGRVGDLSKEEEEEEEALATAQG